MKALLTVERLSIFGAGRFEAQTFWLEECLPVIAWAKAAGRAAWCCVTLALKEVQHSAVALE